MSDIEQAVAVLLWERFGWPTRKGPGREDADRDLVWGDRDNPAWERVTRDLLDALAERGYHVTRSEGLDVERLARALHRYRCNDPDFRQVEWNDLPSREAAVRPFSVPDQSVHRAQAAAIAREYGVTRSDREARLEAALRVLVAEYDKTHLRHDTYYENVADAIDAARALLSEAPE